MQQHYEGIFPKDNPKNTRFAINFFTSIGLGSLTENLREFLLTAPKKIMERKTESSSDSSSSESESSSSSSDSSSSESDGAKERRKRLKRKVK